MRFNLTIKLSNAAMQAPADIAEALRNIADNICEGYEPAVPTQTPGIIRDANGNAVGTWEVKK